MSMTSRRKYPVEHGTATDWDDAGNGVYYVTVLVQAWILELRQL